MNDSNSKRNPPSSKGMREAEIRQRTNNLKADIDAAQVKLMQYTFLEVARKPFEASLEGLAKLISTQGVQSAPSPSFSDHVLAAHSALSKAGDSNLQGNPGASSLVGFTETEAQMAHAMTNLLLIADRYQLRLGEAVVRLAQTRLTQDASAS